MKVAFVLGTSGGGTGRHVAMLAAGLVRRDVPVAVFGPSAGQRDFGFPAFTAVEISDRPRPGDAAALHQLRALLRAGGFSVVHAHGMRAGALTALALLGSRNRPPLVVTVHNAPVSGGMTGAVYRALEVVVARRADAVLGVSPDLEQRMRTAGARQVGHAVVAAPARPATAAPAAPAAPGGYVLGAGRLAVQKDFAVLIKAAARWGDAARLRIAGSGPLEASLRALAAALGVEVEFTGLRDDIPDLLAGADVFALPSQWEGQALILQEALRAGAPIVATSVGGNLAVAGPDAALYVPPGDPDAFAAAVRRVLEDPALAQRMRAAALDRARELPDEQDTVSAALAAYRECTGASCG